MYARPRGVPCLLGFFASMRALSLTMQQYDVQLLKLGFKVLFVLVGAPSPPLPPLCFVAAVPNLRLLRELRPNAAANTPHPGCHAPTNK